MKLDKNVKGGLGRRDAFRKRYGGNYEGGRTPPTPTMPEMPPMSAAAQAVIDQVERIKARQEAAE